MTTTVSTSHQINEFIALFNQGMESISQAAEMLVGILDTNPYAYEAIQKKCPALTTPLLQRLERVGRKQLAPGLFLTMNHAAGELSKLPLSVQERVLAEGVPMLIEKNGEIDAVIVNPKDMTPQQSKQIFTCGRIRTEAEQRLYLIEQAKLAKEQADRERSSKQSPPWLIRGKRVEFREGVTLTAADLASILAQMTK